MNDGVNAFQIRRLDVADILRDPRICAPDVAQNARSVKSNVITRHFVSTLEKNLGKHRPDISLVTRD